MSQDTARPSDASLGFVILIASVAAIGGFLFGFDSGVINGTVGALSEAFQSSSIATGFSVASLLLGCAAGAFVAGPLADAIGRKKSLLITGFLFALSAWGSGVAGTATEFVVYRLIGGLAVGAASVLSPAYISEIAPAHLRGRLASLQQLAIVLGLVGAFLSNYAIAAAAGSAKAPFWLGMQAFRWMLWAELVPSVALILGVLVIPESPRYLVFAGKRAEALDVFRRISGNAAEELVREVEASLHGARPRLRDLLVPGTQRLEPLVWVGLGLSAFQQFVGINVVFYYGEVLWSAAGFTEQQALAVNLLSGTVNVLSTFVAMALIDRVGRKPLLLWGSVGMAFALAGVAFAFSLGTLDATGKLNLGPTAAVSALVLANLYVFSFGVSWGPCVWVLLGEMFPNRFRAAALSLGAGVQWIANFAITLTFPILLASIGLSGSYVVYAGFAALSIPFVIRAVTETKGRTLEEMG